MTIPRNGGVQPGQIAKRSDPEVGYRAALESDRGLIYDTWIRSYQTSHHSGPLPGDLYWPTYSQVVDRLLARPGADVIVAVKPGESPPHDVYGWICLERGRALPVKVQTGRRAEMTMVPLVQPVLHYLYVQQAYRGQGIARDLVTVAGIDLGSYFAHTFATPASWAICKAGKARGASFDPRAARYEPKDQPQEEQR